MLKLKTLLNLCLESVILLFADESMEGTAMCNMRVIKLRDLLQAMLFGIVGTIGPRLRRLKSQGLFLHRCCRAYIQIVLQTRSGLPSWASVAVVNEEGNLSIRLWIMDNGGVATSIIMLLNIQSDYNANVSQQPVFKERTDIPTYRENQSAIWELATGKAGGKSGILPKMVVSTVNMPLLKIFHLVLSVIYYGHAPLKYKFSSRNDS